MLSWKSGNPILTRSGCLRDQRIYFSPIVVIECVTYHLILSLVLSSNFPRIVALDVFQGCVYDVELFVTRPGPPDHRPGT